MLRNADPINRIVNRRLQSIIMLIKGHWEILKVPITKYVRIYNKNAVSNLRHRFAIAFKIDNQFALPAHRKLSSLAPVNPLITRMQRVVPSGNSHPNVNRRPSPYAGYNIAISALIGLRTGIAGDGRIAVTN